MSKKSKNNNTSNCNLYLILALLAIIIIIIYFNPLVNYASALFNKTPQSGGHSITGNNIVSSQYLDNLIKCNNILKEIV